MSFREMTTDRVRLKQLQHLQQLQQQPQSLQSQFQQQQQQQMLLPGYQKSHRHQGGFGTLPLQRRPVGSQMPQQQQQQQQPHVQSTYSRDAGGTTALIRPRRRPLSLAGDDEEAEERDDDDEEVDVRTQEQQPFMLEPGSGVSQPTGGIVGSHVVRGVAMDFGRLAAADSGVDSGGNLTYYGGAKMRGASPASGAGGYRDPSTVLSSGSPQSSSGGGGGGSGEGPAVPQPRIAIPIPPPPSEPPPGTPRSSVLGGNCHYAESAPFGQAYCSVDPADAFYLPPSQYPHYGPGSTAAVAASMLHHQQQHPLMSELLGGSGSGQDSRTGVYDTAGSIRNRGGSKPVSPMAQGSGNSHYPASGGGTDSSASKLMMYHSSKKHGPIHCSPKCSIAVLLLFVLVLVAAVIYLAARSVDLERRMSENFAQNTSLFGLFDANSPPVRMQNSVAYRTTLAPSGYWSGQVECNQNYYLVVNVSLPHLQVAGLYLRKNTLPTVVQYDFFHRLINVQNRMSRAVPVVHFVTQGVWYVSLINDQPAPLTFELRVEKTTKDFHLTDCLNQCSNRGRCVNGKCTCYQGFKGPDCSVGENTLGPTMIG